MIFRLFRRAPQRRSSRHSMARSWHRRALRRFTGATGCRTRSTAVSRWSCSIPCCFCGVWRARRPRAAELGQALFDRFCRDMDDSMREMGVGDLAVPRKMRRIGEAFYGRQAAYRAALCGARRAAACGGAVAQCICRRRQNGERPDGWRPMCARPSAACRAGVDSLQRASSPFPIRQQCSGRRPDDEPR